MDPNQLIPDPEAEIPKKPGIDLSKILLPKKEVVPPSTERVNAGTLLAQEQGAVLTVQGATLQVPTKPVQPATPPPQEEVTVVQPIETYQGAIQSLVQKNDVSVLSIAAAEAARRGSAPLHSGEAAEAGASPLLFKTLLIVLSVVLVCGALAAILFVLLKPAASVNVVKEIPAPFINVDETRSFTVPTQLPDHTTAMKALEEERNKVELALGLIARIYIALPRDPVSNISNQISAQQIITMLGQNVPDTLLRAVDRDEYLLGIHSFDSNQPFLILKTTSYEQAFSGMLAWENNMRRDLSPLFLRTPPSRILDKTLATSSATTTPVVVQTGFVDRIVENHDARVIENSTKDILLLWTFINRNVIVITTNEVTLREIISRLKNAPVVPSL